jgi:hypothetical protein
MNKQVDKFLREQLETTGAQLVECTKQDNFNLMDNHYLAAKMMVINVLIQENNGKTKK